MKIPAEFTLFGNKVTVKIIDRDVDNRYGYWNDAKEEIVIASNVKVDGEIVALTDTQIEITFYHELMHAFQWYSRGMYDEIEAQTYSNLLTEFNRSKK